MKQRLISALVASIILIPLLILGGIYFKIGVTLISLIAVHETLMIKENSPIFIRILSYLLMTMMVILDISIVIKVFVVLFILMIILPFYDKDKYNIEISSYIISFILILGLVFYYICSIRDDDINVLIYLLLITILTDTVAYLIGKPFGKHKIIEKVSPGKTYEGTISGILIGTIIPTIFYVYMVNPGAYIPFIVLMTFTLSIIGQIGDWVFSTIKRFYNIKDYSNIMPGHGGVLDRFDSLIFVIIGYIIIINLI